MAHHEEHKEKQHQGKDLGDVPGNQTPATPNKKESEGEHGGKSEHQSQK